MTEGKCWAQGLIPYRCRKLTLIRSLEILTPLRRHVLSQVRIRYRPQHPADGGPEVNFIQPPLSCGSAPSLQKHCMLLRICLSCRQSREGCAVPETHSTPDGGFLGQHACCSCATAAHCASVLAKLQRRHCRPQLRLSLGASGTECDRCRDKLQDRCDRSSMAHICGICAIALCADSRGACPDCSCRR